MKASPSVPPSLLRVFKMRSLLLLGALLTCPFGKSLLYYIYIEESIQHCQKFNEHILLCIKRFCISVESSPKSYLVETEGADAGPAEAEPELSEYNYADHYGYDYNRAQWPPSQQSPQLPQSANINQMGGWGSGIQWGNRAQNANIGQFGTGNANANVVQGRGGWGGFGGFGQGWPPARHWPGTGPGRGTGGNSNANIVQRGGPGGTANANIVQGPGGPRGRLTQNASGCRCYFKGKPCSGRGKAFLTLHWWLVF